MYLGRMPLIEFNSKDKNPFNKVKEWFSCILNMYNTPKELRFRLGEGVLDKFNPQLN